MSLDCRPEIPRKTSSIWYHFNQKDDGLGECKYCKALLSFAGGSINNLKRHLRNKHITVAINSNFASATAIGDCQDNRGTRKKGLQKKHKNVAFNNDVETVFLDEESSLSSTQIDYQDDSNDSLSTTVHTLKEKPTIVAVESNLESVVSREENSLATAQKNCQDDDALLNTGGDSIQKQSIEKQTEEAFESDVESVYFDDEDEPSLITTMTNCQDDSNALLRTQKLKENHTTEVNKRDVEPVASVDEFPFSQKDSQDCINTLLRTSGGFMKKHLKKKSPAIVVDLASAISQNESGLSIPSTSGRSPLWNHFSKKKDGKGECKYCKAKVSMRGSISNLKRHLQTKHPVIAVKNNFKPYGGNLFKSSPLWYHFNKKEGNKGECKYCFASLSIAGGSISNLKRHLKKKHPTVAVKVNVDLAASKQKSLSPTQTDFQKDINASRNNAEGSLVNSTKKEHTFVADKIVVESVPSEEETGLFSTHTDFHEDNNDLLNTAEGSMKTSLKKKSPTIAIESNLVSVPSQSEAGLSKSSTSSRSPLWNHFNKKKDGKGECKYCKAKVSVRGSTSNLKRHLQKKHPVIAVKNNFRSSGGKLFKSSPLWYHFNKKEGSKGECKYCFALLSIAGGSISNLKRHLKKKHPTVASKSNVDSAFLSPTQTDHQEDVNALLKVAKGSTIKSLTNKHSTVSDESDIESVPSEGETGLSSTQTDCQDAEGSMRKFLEKEHTIAADASDLGQTKEAVEIFVESIAAGEEFCFSITQTDCQDNSNAMLSTAGNTTKKSFIDKVTAEADDNYVESVTSGVNSCLLIPPTDCQQDSNDLLSITEDSTKKSFIEKQITEADDDDIESVTSMMELCSPTTQTDTQVIKVLLSTDGNSEEKVFLLKERPPIPVKRNVGSVASGVEPCLLRTPISRKSLVWCHFNKKGGGRGECKYCSAMFRGSIMAMKRHLERKHPAIAVKSNLAVESRTCISRSSPLLQHFNKKEDGRCECKHCFALLSIEGSSFNNLKRHLQRKHPTISITSNKGSAISGTESSFLTSHTESQDNSNALFLLSSDGVFTKKKNDVDTNVESVVSRVECLPETPISKGKQIKRSLIWCHFNKKEDDRGECKYCYALLSTAGGSISNLKRHLQNKHLEIAVESNCAPPTPENDPAPSAIESHSPTIANSRRSFIWQHFIKKGKGYGECNYCNAWLSFAGGSTSNLKRHLQKKHPTVLPEEIAESITVESACSLDGSPGYEVEFDNIIVSNQVSEFPTHQPSISNTEISHSQTTLEHSLQTTKLPIVAKDYKFNLQVLKMICKEFHSFRLVEDVEFKKFVSLLCPGYRLPSRKTFSQTILPQVYDELVVKIKLQLLESTAVALTTQCWTSVYDQCFIVIIAHYFNETTTLRSCLLGSIEYDQNNFSETLTKFCRDWEINFKISAIITDNNFDRVAAIKQCQWKHISCYANSINSVLKTSVKPADSIIKKIKSLVQYFKRCPEAVLTLHDVQKQMGIPPMKFKQDVSTKWESTYDMLSNVYSNRTMIMSTLTVLGNVDVDISPGEWDVCQHLITLLEIFEEVSNEISSDKSVSLSETAMINMTLSDYLVNYKRTPNLPDRVIELCNVFEEEINKMSRRPDDNLELKFEAALLDPRFKQNAFEKDKTLYNQIYESLITQIQMLIISEPDLSPSQTFGSLWSEFDNEVAAFNRSCKPRSSSIVELDNYLAESILPRICDPMPWWEERKLVYPNLYKIVLKKLCIPASLVPSKQMFSNASHILKEKPSGLGSSKVNKIVFLNCNL